MQTVLLNTGKGALAAAIAEGKKLRVGAYRVGQAANFTPLVTALNVAPVSVYQGDTANIATSLINEDNVRYVVTVPEIAGPFNVGNIMLFLKNDDGVLIPYLYGVLPVAIPKYKNNPPATIGNKLVFTLTAKYTNVSEAFDLIITPPMYASLTNYRDEYELPNPQASSYQEAVLQNNTVTGSPAMVARRERDNSWFVNTFFQRLDDPSWGTLSGGVVGDNYLPFLGDYNAGGLYKTPPAGYTANLDGGEAWAVPTEADLPTDAGAYVG